MNAQAQTSSKTQAQPHLGERKHIVNLVLPFEGENEEPRFPKGGEVLSAFCIMRGYEATPTVAVLADRDAPLETRHFYVARGTFVLTSRPIGRFIGSGQFPEGGAFHVFEMGAVEA